MRAVQINEFGGPEVLEVTDVPKPVPGEDEVEIEVSRAGINYADTHQAENSYLAPASLPLIPGTEVAGRTAEGRRVVALLGSGGYAERAVAATATTFDIPDGIDDGTALALVLQGLTAWHLLRTSARMREGETVAVLAAAGGVGTIAVQLARELGAGRVIGAASTEQKRALATDLGADAVLDSRAEDLTDALRTANDGEAVDVVLEMVGGEVTGACLSALAPFGRLVHFGQASRTAPEPVDPGYLMYKSRAVAGFWLMHCMRAPDRHLREPLGELFELVRAGRLRAVVGEVYGLSEADRAHRELRERDTVGKLLLDPSS